MAVWIEASVTMEDLPHYPCQVSGYWWKGWAVPRFTREVMGRVVEDFHAMHEHYAARGHLEAVWDTAWDGSSVIVHDYAYPNPDAGTDYARERIDPDADGMYEFGGGILCWEIAEEPWDGREAQLAEALASPRIRALARRLGYEPGTTAQGGPLAQCEDYAQAQQLLTRLGIPLFHVGAALTAIGLAPYSSSNQQAPSHQATS
jgi:hypothetical protein